MPLSELLYRMAKGKLDSSQHNKDLSCSSALHFSPPENDVAELIWENGQVLSSGRVRKIEALQPQSPRGRGRGEASRTTGFKFGGKYGSMEHLLHQDPMPLEIDLDQDDDDDDDMLPWLNYPIEDNLQHDYCSELSGVTVAGNSAQNNLASSSRGSSDRYVEMQYGERVDQERFCSPVDDSFRSSAGPSHCQMSPVSFPCFRSRVASSSCHNVQLAAAPVSEDPMRIPTSRGGFLATKSQDQVPAAPATHQHFLNSSHFTRPPSEKAKLDGISETAVPTSSSMQTITTSRTGSIPCTTNHVEFSLIESCSGTKSPTKSSELNRVSSEKRPVEETVPQELPGSAIQDDGCKSSKICGGHGAKGLDDREKNVELVNASSVGSGNTVGRASDDAVQNKRKHRDTDDCEDADEESIGAKRSASARGSTGARRSRAAEVHNLSERRRRDRINEKMRALQELIPNCNKVDKASMLDEAIDYLKTLQLQVQIMSMGSGLYMPSMVLPPGMSQMHAAHMARFSNVGVGMGMSIGYGMGMPDVNGGASGMLQAHHLIPGAHFLSPPMPGPNPLNGFGFGFGFGNPGQGLPMAYPHMPIMPIPGGPVLNTTMGTPAHGLQGPSDSQDVAPSLVTRGAISSINSQVIQQNGANSSANPASSKCQETKESRQQSALVGSEHQPAGIADNEASKLADVNDQDGHE